MHRIKDRFFLGLIAGLGANLVKEAIAETSIRTGLTKYSCRRMIPLLVLKKKYNKSWKGKVIGTTTDMTIAGLTGILLTYVISLTGKDYSRLKGIMVSNGILDQVFNAFAIGLPTVRRDPNSNLLCRAIHSVFGIIAATIITSLGDPSLFRKNLSQEEMESKKLNA